MRKGFVGQFIPVLAAAAVLAVGAFAQSPPNAKLDFPVTPPLPPVSPEPPTEAPVPPPLPPVTADYKASPMERPAIIQANAGMPTGTCTNCGLPRRHALPPMPPMDECGGNCIPGGHCCRCEDYGGFAGLYCHFYNAFQCPDPCYEPYWEHGANAALFVDTVPPEDLDAAFAGIAEST